MNDEHLLSHIGQYALIKNSENKILILERARSKTWCLPGGRLNENEEWDEAFLRELKEELNLDCFNPNPIEVNILKDDYQTKYCVYFSVICPDMNSIKISDEHSNFGWFSIEEMNQLDIEDDKIRRVISDFIN